MDAKAHGENVVVTVSQNSFGVKENPVAGSEEVKKFLFLQKVLLW